MEAPRGKV